MNKNFALTIFVLCVFLLTSSFALATNHNVISSQTMTLLAVSEGGPLNESVGSVASVTLDIVDGTGRVLINTYPFSKVDTQVSVRLANEVACHFLSYDCSQYDFIYSIKTGGSTIGGPSAGAAISALTVASLDGEYIKENTTISGTINSGGVVGAVGGLKEKISAAAELGIELVIVPLGERYIIEKVGAQSSEESSDNETEISSQINQSNITSEESSDESSDSLITLPLKTDLVAYGLSKGVSVIEVGTLDEVLSLITNKQYILPTVTVEPPLFYTTQMKRVSQELCLHARNLLDNLSVNVSYGKFKLHIDNSTTFAPNQTVIIENSNIDIAATLNSARQSLNVSKTAFNEGSYYASASYCYSAALNLRFISLLNNTPEQVREVATKIVNETQSQINLSQYRTITDIQTYMLVDERITEANDRINDGNKFATKNLSVLAINSYATAIERIYSAKLWSAFFSTTENEIALDLTQVDESCKLKIQEAAERQSLIGYYVEDLDVGSELISQAQKQLGKNPILCLFAASKAKATYDVVLSSLGLDENAFNATFEKKSQIAARVIDEQFSRDAFPIIGYSYYEYAISLSDTDPSAALLYIQYALELSNLDAYLPQSISNNNISENKFRKYFSLGRNEVFVLGIALGLLLGITLIKVEGFAKGRKTQSTSNKRSIVINLKKDRSNR